MSYGPVAQWVSPHWPSLEPRILLESLDCRDRLNDLIWARNRVSVLLLQISRLGVVWWYNRRPQYLNTCGGERGNDPGISFTTTGTGCSEGSWRQSVEIKDILCFYERERGCYAGYYYDLLRSRDSHRYWPADHFLSPPRLRISNR